MYSGCPNNKTSSKEYVLDSRSNMASFEKPTDQMVKVRYSRLLMRPETQLSDGEMQNGINGHRDAGSRSLTYIFPNKDLLLSSSAQSYHSLH